MRRFLPVGRGLGSTTVAVVADVEFDMQSRPTSAGYWALALVPLGFLLVFAVAASNEGSDVLLVIVAVFVLAMMALLMHIGRITPHQARLTDTAIELRANAGPRTIPWNDLVSISVRTDHLFWTVRSQRGAIQTPGGFPHLERFLAEIASRAPDVEIER